MHPKIVSERLGHADIALTLNVYGHAIPALEETAAALVSNLILEPKFAPFADRLETLSGKR